MQLSFCLSLFLFLWFCGIKYRPPTHQLIKSWFHPGSNNSKPKTILMTNLFKYSTGQSCSQSELKRKNIKTCIFMPLEYCFISLCNLTSYPYKVQCSYLVCILFQTLSEDTNTGYLLTVWPCDPSRGTVFHKHILYECVNHQSFQNYRWLLFRSYKEYWEMQ